MEYRPCDIFGASGPNGEAERTTSAVGNRVVQRSSRQRDTDQPRDASVGHRIEIETASKIYFLILISYIPVDTLRHQIQVTASLKNTVPRERHCNSVSMSVLNFPL